MKTITQLQTRYALYMWDIKVREYREAYITEDFDDVAKVLTNTYFSCNKDRVNLREEMLINDKWICTGHLLSGVNPR